MSDGPGAKLRISLDGRDELVQFFDKSGAATKRFGQSVRDELSRTGNDLRNWTSQATRAAGALAGIGAGLGIADQARKVIELRDAITGLAATAGLGEDAIAGLRLQIKGTAADVNQLGTDLAEALNVFVAKTGDIETGRRNLELYGKTATATRASVAEIAAIGADLNKLKITDQGSALAVLAKQADVGAVELRDLVSQGPRLLAAFQAAGLSGEKGLREGGAFTQVAMSGIGNVERTSTSVEAAFRDVALHAPQLQQAGIQVYDPNTHQARDRVEVILDVIRKAKGREDILRRIFQEEGIRAIQPLAAEYRDTGGFGTFERFRDVAADQSIIDAKFKLNTSSAAAKLKASQIAMQNASDARLGDSIESLADHSGLLAEGYDTVLQHPLLAAGGALAARSGLRMGGSALSNYARSRFGGVFGRAAGAASSAITEAGGEGVRVFVTNWPGGFGGDLLGGGKGLLGAGGAGGVGAGGELGAILGPGFGASLGIGIAGALGAALNLYAVGKATEPLNKAMPQIRAETEEQLRRHDEILRENAERDRKDARNLVTTTAGTYGGKVTAAQARAAQMGFGAFGMAPADVIAQFQSQQRTLSAIATGEEAGLDQGFIGSQVEGGEFLLNAIAETNPAFKSAKNGRERAAIIRRMIAANERAARGGAGGGVSPDSYIGMRLAMSAGDLETPEWARGHDFDLGAPAAAAPTAPAFDEKKFWEGARDALGLNLTINIDAQGNVSTEGDFGTRSPDVQVRRTTGAF